LAEAKPSHKSLPAQLWCLDAKIGTKKACVVGVLMHMTNADPL